MPLRMTVPICWRGLGWRRSRRFISATGIFPCLGPDDLALGAGLVTAGSSGIFLTRSFLRVPSPEAPESSCVRLPVSLLIPGRQGRAPIPFSSARVEASGSSARSRARIELPTLIEARSSCIEIAPTRRTLLMPYGAVKKASPESIRTASPCGQVFLKDVVM